MVVAFLSPRGISLRVLPDSLPLVWFVPVPRQPEASGVLHAEPEWRLHEYVKADRLTYIERDPAAKTT